MNTTIPRSVHSKILADLRTLRENLAQARSGLMHFRDDRVDRDKLEPAARRVDDLMNLFAGTDRDVARGALWVNEIQSSIDTVNNPKAAESLQAARADVASLLQSLAATG